MQVGGPIHFYDLPEEGRGEGQGKEGTIKVLILQPTRHYGAVLGESCPTTWHEQMVTLETIRGLEGISERSGAARLFNTTDEHGDLEGVFNCQLVEGYIAASKVQLI